MFHKTTDINASNLKYEIDRLIESMADTHEKDSPEYKEKAARLVELYTLRKVDSEVNSGRRLSADTIAAITANLAGILIIVNYERAAVLTSKAVSMLKIVK